MLVSLFFQFMLQARSTEKVISGAVGIGVPQLIFGEISILALNPVGLSVFAGTLPISAYLQDRISIPSQTLEVESLGLRFVMTSSVQFSVVSLGGGVKFHFGDTGLFSELGFTQLRAIATLRSDLTNELTQRTVSGVIAGTLNLNQQIISLRFGYKLQTQIGFFFETKLGAGYLFRRTYELSLTGKAVEFSTLVPQIDELVEQTKTKIQNSISEALGSIPIQFIPELTLSLGWAF